MWVWSLASLSGLRIWCCHKLPCGSQMKLRSYVAVVVAKASSCSSNSIPSLGTSICCRCSCKKKKKKKKSQPIPRESEQFWEKSNLGAIFLYLCSPSITWDPCLSVNNSLSPKRPNQKVELPDLPQKRTCVQRGSQEGEKNGCLAPCRPLSESTTDTSFPPLPASVSPFCPLRNVHC